MECFKCGVSDSKEKLYDVIVSEGVVKMCENCMRNEDLPVVRRPTTVQLKEMERKPTVYERLSKAAGINPNERRREKTRDVITQETNLRLLVDKNYQEKVAQRAQPRPDLIDNFHWALMRARRSKKITQKQLAESLGEPEMAIKMAEEGKLPGEDMRLVNKLQAFLGINLLREQPKSSGQNIYSPNPFGTGKGSNSAFAGAGAGTHHSSDISFDKETLNSLKIADLKRIKDEKESAEMWKNAGEMENAEGQEGQDSKKPEKKGLRKFFNF